MSGMMPMPLSTRVTFEMTISMNVWGGGRAKKTERFSLHSTSLPERVGGGSKYRKSGDLEVDGVVEAPPDEEAPDVAAAGQPVLVNVDSKQAAVSFVVDPLLILVGVTCVDKICHLSTGCTN